MFDSKSMKPFPYNGSTEALFARSSLVTPSLISTYLRSLDKLCLSFVLSKHSIFFSFSTSSILPVAFTSVGYKTVVVSMFSKPSSGSSGLYNIRLFYNQLLILPNFSKQNSTFIFILSGSILFFRDSNSRLRSVTPSITMSPLAAISNVEKQKQVK